jgi:hypothetical protein
MRIHRGIWLNGNVFWLWPVMRGVSYVNSNLKTLLKCLVRRLFMSKSLHLLFRLVTLMQRLEVRWPVVREVHGLCNLRAASFSEVLIVGGLIVISKARPGEGDNYVTL